MTKVINTTTMTSETLGNLVEMLVIQLAIQSEKLDFIVKQASALEKVCHLLHEAVSEMEVTLYAPAGLAPKK